MGEERGKKGRLESGTDRRPQKKLQRARSIRVTSRSLRPAGRAQSRTVSAPLPARLRLRFPRFLPAEPRAGFYSCCSEPNVPAAPGPSVSLEDREPAALAPACVSAWARPPGPAGRA